jgi:2-iminobutanoate/2-iminopropanoate deaminase
MILIFDSSGIFVKLAKNNKGGFMKNKILSVFLLIPPALLFLLTTSSFSQKKASPKKIYYLTDEPGDLPFSPAILVKDTLFISGQLATDPATGKYLGGTMAQQAERIIKNMEILLQKAGMDLSHVVKTTAYIADFNEFAEFNTVFRRMFPADPPTRATVQVAKLARDAKIEISAVAVK